MSEQQQLEELQHIRGIMDRSTRFLSLSGLSGIWAGVVALCGALAAWQHYQALLFNGGADLAVDVYSPRWNDQAWTAHVTFLIADALLVLMVALAGAAWFTWRRSRRTGQAIWDATARRLMANLLLPLIASGGFCIALLYHGEALLVAPATLVFYGLALLNASKYTLDEIRWLGMSEIALGIISMFWPGTGLMFWALGFGALHIVYGSLMYARYERAVTTTK